MFKVNYKDTRTTPNSVVLVSLLLLKKYFTPLSSVSILNFEQVSAGWEINTLQPSFHIFSKKTLIQDLRQGLRSYQDVRRCPYFETTNT